jgi:hypothetical protein
MHPIFQRLEQGRRAVVAEAERTAEAARRHRQCRLPFELVPVATDAARAFAADLSRFAEAMSRRPSDRSIMRPDGIALRSIRPQ